jgi:hypothetical protein
MKMYKVTIRVVATMATDKFNHSMENAINYTVENVLSVGVGGVTVDPASMGYWKDASGKVVGELGCNVWTLCEGGQIVPLMAVANQIKVLGNQDCVLFTVEEVKDVSFV